MALAPALAEMERAVGKVATVVAAAAVEADTDRYYAAPNATGAAGPGRRGEEGRSLSRCRCRPRTDLA